MLYKFSTKPQHAFNFWCLSFVLTTKCTFPPLTVRPLMRKTVHCLRLMGIGKPARTGSTLADLLFHSWHPSKCRFGVCPDAGVGWRRRFDAEDLPHMIFSRCLADATKCFSHNSIDPLNTHGMKAALALSQEGVFISQHHSSIFTQTTPETNTTHSSWCV